MFTSNNNIIFYVTTKDIYLCKKENSLLKQTLEYNWVLQEFCKTVRRRNLAWNNHIDRVTTCWASSDATNDRRHQKQKQTRILRW